MTISEAVLYSPTSDSHDVSGLKELKEIESLQTDSAALDSTVWKKLDKRILPLCTGFFLLAAMDRTNIANARIVGLQQTLGLSNYQYTVALTVTYIPFIFSGFIFSLVLKLAGPNILLPTMVVLWGVAAASQGLVKGYSGLLACRFFLGLFEGGLTPGLVLYLSFFYPRKTLQKRVSGFYVTGNFIGAFAGLLAAGIDQMNGMGGRPGWAWIFIMEGIITIAFGLVTFFFLPGSPEKAHFLTGRERDYIVSTLKSAGSVSEDEDKDNFSWTEVARSAISPHVWFFTIISFFAGTVLYGMAFFEPSIVASLGYSGNQAQLMSTPPFAATFVVSLIVAIISDRYQCRGLSLMFSALLGVIGWSMFYASHSNHVRYASLFFSCGGAMGSMPVVLTWLANNCAPQTRRATAVAANNVATQVGGILSTWLLGFLSPAPEYTSATITLLSMSIGLVVFSMINLAYLWRENRLKAERRKIMRRDDEPDGLGDGSAWFIYSL